jgi:hypothetical protein
MRILGNAGKQILVLVAEATQTTVSLDCNGNGTFTDPEDINARVFPGAIQTYDIQLLGTDDITVNIPTNWSGVSKDFQIVLLGAPNSVTVTTAPGVALQNNSSFLMNISGYIGNDKVNVTAPTVDNSSFIVRSELSAGDDQEIVTLGNVLNHGVVDIDAVLDIGTNAFSLVQPAGTSVNGGTVMVRVEGDVGTDRVFTSLAGNVGPGRLELNADLGPGNDVYTGTVDLANFKIGTGGVVRLNVDGGDGSDQLKVTRNGTTGAGAATNLGLFDVRLNGGPGNDLIQVDLAGGGFKMDGGTLAVRANGGAANDTVTVLLDADPTSTNPNFDVVVWGGNQNDIVRVVVNGPATPANYGPVGAVLVDGGFGLDTCSVSGTGVIKQRSCEKIVP